MSATYSNVDCASDPGHAVADQERIDSWPQIQAYKRRTYELLAGMSPVLDVGCGPGLDLVALDGAAVGLDPSNAMCSRARSRGCDVVRGDALAIPIADAACGGVRADRVIQHVENPEAAIREMARVCRPGGRVVVADPDQETLTIRVPGVRQDLADAVKQRRRDVGYRNGRFISALPEVLAELGFIDVTLDAFPLTLTRPTDAFGLAGWPRLWRFDAADIEEWEHGVNGTSIVYALLYFVVSGQRT